MKPCALVLLLLLQFSNVGNAETPATASTQTKASAKSTKPKRSMGGQPHARKTGFTITLTPKDPKAADANSALPSTDAVTK
jgi:hypothetical protein